VGVQLESASLWGRLDRQASIWIFLLTVAFVVFHSYALFERFSNYHWEGFSLGVYAQLLWNMAHGNNISSVLNIHVTALHAPWILFVLAPLYGLIADPYFLSILQTLALAAGCLFVFAISTSYVNRFGSFLIAVAYCFYPPVAAMNMATFHPAVLALPFLGGAVLAYQHHRTLWYLFLLAGALSCDVRLALLIGVLSVIALLEQRSWFWRLTPLAYLALAFALSLKFSWSFTGFEKTALYGAVTAPFLFWFLAFVFQKIHQMGRERWLITSTVSIAVLVGVFFGGAMMHPASFAKASSSGHLPMRKSVLNWLLEKVPPKASVITTPLFLPKLANREDLRLMTTELGENENMLWKDRTPKVDVDYALVDFGQFFLSQTKEVLENNTLHPMAMNQLRQFFAKEWVPIENVGSMVLFSSIEPEPEASLYETIDLRTDRPYMVYNSTVDDELNFVGFTMESDRENKDIIRFVFYWEKQKESKKQYGMFFNIMTPEGRVIHTVKKPLCFQLYPFEEWKVGEVVKEHYALVVPEELIHSSYEVHLGVYDVESSELKKMQSTRQNVVDPWGLTKLIALDAV